MSGPNFNQRDYRFRNDDGSETSATWRGALNTPSILYTNTVYRVRVAITNPGSSSVLTPDIYFSLNGGAWTEIDYTSPLMQSTKAATVADMSATTQQISSPDAFAPGLFDCHYANPGSTAAYNNATCEVEFTFKILATAANPNDSIRLQIRHNYGNLTTYTNYPTIIVAAALPAILIIAEDD